MYELSIRLSLVTESCPKNQRSEKNIYILLCVDNEFTPHTAHAYRPIFMKFGTTGLAQCCSGFGEFHENRHCEDLAFLNGVTEIIFTGVYSENL
jgi:hypothetical protein